MSEGPPGWSTATLERLAGRNGVVTDGDWVESKHQDQGGSVRLIQLADVGDGYFANRSRRFMNLETVHRLNCTVLRPGDLLIARMPEPLGRACQFPDIHQDAVTVVDVLIWRPDAIEAGADPRWLMHAINSPTVREQIWIRSGGSTRQRITGGKLKSLEIPVPPLPEQRRIAERVDHLLARTARASTELTKVEALISQYKSAVLQLAFSGGLTADLRNESSPSQPMPANWTVRQLGELGDIQSGVQVGKKRTGQEPLVEVPYLRVANVQRGWLDLGDTRKILVTPAEKERLLLRKGDILMNEGGDRDKLGRGWVWEEQIPECIHQNHVFRIRLKSPELPPEYVSHFANENGQAYFFDQGTQTTNLASISKRRLAALPIPVPPAEEAVEIVRRVGLALEWLDRISVSYTNASHLLAQLDGAILAKALRGELVSQDPGDEPAEALLRRIEGPQSGRKLARRARRLGDRIKDETMAGVKRLEQVLAEADGWISAQNALQLCGIGDGAETEDIEQFYVQLRDLDLQGRLDVKAVPGADGRKSEDYVKLKAA